MFMTWQGHVVWHWRHPNPTGRSLISEVESIIRFVPWPTSWRKPWAKTILILKLPEITGDYRVGDIRHCFADISKARRILGFQPQVSLESGMQELVAWLESQLA